MFPESPAPDGASSPPGAPSPPSAATPAAGRAAPLGPVHLILNVSAIGGAGAFGPVSAVFARVERLLDAGLPSLQLRFPRDADPNDATRHVDRCAPLCELARRRGARVIVNGPFDAALRLGADGVHLPAHGPSAETARSALRPNALVGRSAHDEGELARAAGCDWVLLSPVFATTSKPGAPALGLEEFARLVAGAKTPVYALGGVTSERLASCFGAGAAGVAAISALFADDGPDFVRSAVSIAAKIAR